MEKKIHRVGIIMNGVTGRMGTNQHLMRSIVAIREQGGVHVNKNEVILPDPILVGRNVDKLKKISELSGVTAWTTDLHEALSDPNYPVYFDAQTTSRRFEAVHQAIDAGKHIYCEKPTALNSADAYGLYEKARSAGVKNGVIQDKLWLPGLLKLKKLIDAGFFGRILSVRGEFGYWVFTGYDGEPQRPSWNYKKEEGGGIIFDMFAHWEYVLANLFGEVQSLSCFGATHIKKRLDEKGHAYDATADDAAYATFLLENDIVAHFNSSWAVRVRRDDLLTLQVDGTDGSAVAGLRQCRIQPSSKTPRPVWNPDLDSPIDFYENWQPAPSEDHYDNAFKIQWELFLRHVVLNEPFRWDLREAAKGVQLAEKAIESWNKRAWVNIPDLPA